jgi:hypothetical protein
MMAPTAKSGQGDRVAAVAAAASMTKMLPKMLRDAHRAKVGVDVPKAK